MYVTAAPPELVIGKEYPRFPLGSITKFPTQVTLYFPELSFVGGVEDVPTKYKSGVGTCVCHTPMPVGATLLYGCPVTSADWDPNFHAKYPSMYCRLVVDNALL